jgi:hypothetical protein
MPLADLLQVLPSALRARFYASGKAAPGGNAPEGETLLRASETLRRAISLLKHPSDPDRHEATAALQALSRMRATSTSTTSRSFGSTRKLSGVPHEFRAFAGKPPREWTCLRMEGQPVLKHRRP